MAIRETVSDLLSSLASTRSRGSERSVRILCSHDSDYQTNITGSFAAWGAPDVTVSGGNYLPELIARFFLESAGFTVPETAASDTAALSPGLIVAVVDGSAGLTARAPLSLLDHAPEIHQWCEQFLGNPKKYCGQYDRARMVQAGVLDPRIWSELTRLVPHVTKAELVASDFSLGVGRYVARWELTTS